MTDAWRKHAFGLWVLAVIDVLLMLGLLAVVVLSDEGADVGVLLLSALLTMVGVVTGFVMLFRTLGTYRELSGTTWPLVARVLVVFIAAALILWPTVGSSLFE